jgi:hypothetical protein
MPQRKALDAPVLVPLQLDKPTFQNHARKEEKAALFLLDPGEVNNLCAVLTTLACPSVVGIVDRRRTRGLAMLPLGRSARVTWIPLLDDKILAFKCLVVKASAYHTLAFCWISLSTASFRISSSVRRSMRSAGVGLGVRGMIICFRRSSAIC